MFPWGNRCRNCWKSCWCRIWYGEMFGFGGNVGPISGSAAIDACTGEGDRFATEWDEECEDGGPVSISCPCPSPFLFWTNVQFGKYFERKKSIFPSNSFWFSFGSKRIILSSSDFVARFRGSSSKRFRPTFLFFFFHPCGSGMSKSGSCVSVPSSFLKTGST